MRAAVGVFCAAFATSAVAQESVEIFDFQDFRIFGQGTALEFLRIDRSSQPDLNGSGISFGIAGRWADFGGNPLFLELGLSHIRADSASSSFEVQDGGTPFAVASRQSPVGTIALEDLVVPESVTAESNVLVTGASGNVIEIRSFATSGPEGQVSSFAVSSRDGLGAFTSVTTDGIGVRTTTFGAIQDEVGVTILGSGDGTISTLETTETNDLTLDDQRLVLSTVLDASGTWMVAPKVGLTTGTLSQSVSTLTSVDIEEGFDDAVPMPILQTNRIMTVNNDYYGLLVGATLSRPIGNQWRFLTGVEVGSQSYQAAGRVQETFGMDGVKMASFDGPRLSTNGRMNSGRLNFGLTRVLKPGVALNIGGYASMTTDVPYLFETITGAPTINQTPQENGNETTVGGDGEVYRDYEFRTESFFQTGISMSIVMTF